MELDKQTLRSITEEYGVRHLGYYVILHLFGPLNPSRMADKCKISQGQCRKIEQDLVSMGLLSVSGVGRGRTVEIVRPEVDEEARDVLAYFASRMRKDLDASDGWYQRQYKIAQDLIDKFGYEACLFMIDYLATRGENIYSLNFLKAVASELLPKYRLYKKAKGRSKVGQDAWNALSQKPVPQKQIRDIVSSNDIESILDFGVEI